MPPTGTPAPDFRLLVADRVFDGLGGPPIDEGAVLLQGDRIVRVGPASEVRAPDGASAEETRYDGGSLLPGYVDAHTHVVSPGDGTPGEGVAAMDEPTLLMIAVANVRRMLNNGVTTARENGAKGRVGFNIRDGIRRGIIPGPRMVISGRPIATTGGHLHFFGQPADGVEGVRHATRVLIADGADWIKVTATGGSTRSSDPLRPSFTTDELRTIVDEAHNRGRLVGAHTTAAAGVERVLDAGIDMVIHCQFLYPDGSYRFRDDLVGQIVRDSRWVNPTLHTQWTEIDGLEGKRAREGGLSAADEAQQADNRATMDTLLDATGRMYRAGVKLTAGSDTAWRWGRAGGLAGEVYQLGAAGVPAAEAIVAGTSGAAESIGVSDVAGRLAEGRQADVVAVEGNPLDDLRALSAIRDVWQAGRRIERTEV
jgi:imidazolonepropionase-like amidohydrolase